jgi:hypothetical protein
MHPFQNKNFSQIDFMIDWMHGVITAAQIFMQFLNKPKRKTQDYVESEI